MSTQPNRAIEHFRFITCTDNMFKVVHPHKADEVANFCFQDDTWDLLDILKPHQRRWDSRIGFHNVAPWLRGDAKRYIAHLWLRTEPTMNELQQIMVTLRDLGRLLPDFGGRPIDLRLRHAREVTRKYCEYDLTGGYYQKVRRHLNRFMTFVRQQHPEVKDNDFKIAFPGSKTFMPQHQPLEKARDAKIETERLTMIVDACTADVNAYRKAKENYIDPSDDMAAYRARIDRERNLRKKRGEPAMKPGPKLPHLLGRAIKAQATILSICVGRRAGAVCNTAFDTKAERVRLINEAGQQEEGVRVRFRERKIRNVDEYVHCPDVFGELALQAIQTAKELTEELRRLNPEWKDYLFIVPTRKMNVARVLRPQQINEYMNGAGSSGKGLRERYNLPGGKIHYSQLSRHPRDECLVGRHGGSRSRLRLGARERGDDHTSLHRGK